MKNWIIIFLLFSAFGYCQNPNTIFFKPDNSISADSIVFKNKKLGEINGILKFKRNKKIKFSVYKNGKKYDFKISETSLGVINVLSLKLTSDNKISLSVHRGEILYGSTLKDTCTNDCFQLNIQSYFFWRDNGRFETGNEELSKELNDHFKFYLF